MATRVTVGVCGGIAAYRAVELVRGLQDAGLDPHVVMTRSAEEFVTPLTFAAISGHRVISTLWIGGEVPAGAAPGAPAGSSVEHIEEAQTTSALIVVPATANVLAKFAHGLADDFLSTLYTAIDPATPVILAPAMNVVMWQHPAVQANVRLLRDRGNLIVEPGTGYLACGMQGSGRLAEIPAIVAAVLTSLQQKQDLARETVLVTAGGTREAIDQVRFLGNRSSGRMGHALAEAAHARGAKVMLVTASALPVAPGIEVIPATTAAAMREAVLARLPEATLVIKAAAVADYRVRIPFAGKLARDGARTLELEPTEDIVAEVVRQRAPGTIVVAFAAEVENIAERAYAKMLRKGVDAIVVNDVSAPGLGFDSERNAGLMLIGQRRIALPESSKRVMADRILDEVACLRASLTASL